MFNVIDGQKSVKVKTKITYQNHLMNIKYNIFQNRGSYSTLTTLRKGCRNQKGDFTQF